MCNGGGGAKGGQQRVGKSLVKPDEDVEGKVAVISLLLLQPTDKDLQTKLLP